MSLDYLFDAGSSLENSEMEVINELLSGAIPWVALNPSSYLLHCQPWRWWTQGRQLTTPPLITKQKKEKKRDRWKKVWLPSFNASLTHTTFRGAAWGGNYEVYAITWNRISNIPQLHPLKLGIRLLRCIAFLLFLELSVIHIYCRQGFQRVCHTVTTAVWWHCYFHVPQMWCLC